VVLLPTKFKLQATNKTRYQAGGWVRKIFRGTDRMEMPMAAENLNW